MKQISDDTVTYMNRVWGFDGTDQVDDMAMFWECGEYQMVAKRLVEAGAVEPNCKEAKEMIRVASSISNEEEMEIITDCLANFTILECSECNHVHFISQYNDINDWIKGGCNSCLSKGTVKEVKS